MVQILCGASIAKRDKRFVHASVHAHGVAAGAEWEPVEIDGCVADASHIISRHAVGSVHGYDTAGGGAWGVTYARRLVIWIHTAIATMATPIPM